MQPWQNMLCANDNLGWVACNHARSAGHTKLESFANPSVGHTDLDCRPIWTMLAQLSSEQLDLCFLPGLCPCPGTLPLQASVCCVCQDKQCWHCMQGPSPLCSPHAAGAELCMKRSTGSAA